MDEEKELEINVNKNFVLVKRYEGLNNTGVLLELDASGNSVKGVIVATGSDDFTVGECAYCQGGTDVTVKGERLLVVPVDKVFFTTNE